MSKMMVRSARDQFEALKTAEAMEAAGGAVISVTYDGEHKQHGAMIPCSKFCVFARIPDEIDINLVDQYIDHALFPDECPSPVTVTEDQTQ